MNHDDWLTQAEIYALGALDGDEHTAFEGHLAAGCPECDQHIRKTREALTLLPQSLELVTPPAGVKERLLARIAAETPLSEHFRRPHRRRWWTMGVSALAAASLLIVLGYRLYQTHQEFQQERGAVSALRAELQRRDAALRANQQEVERLQGLVASLQATVTEREAALEAERHERQRATEMVGVLQTELAKREQTLEAERHELQRVERAVASLRSEIDERDAILRQLSAPEVRLVRLEGQVPSPSASAHLLWNPTMRVGFLLTSGLPQLPRNKIYELWAIAGNELVPAGLFTVDKVGHAVVKLRSLPRSKQRFDRFAVTIEPAGGVPKPTGAIHLAGSL
jgi:anti-sigma-K factor RskA